MDSVARKSGIKSNSPDKTNKRSSIVKRMLLHDVGNFFAESIFENLSQDIFLLHADSSIAPCKGCFSCWISTPGCCSIKDDAQNIPAIIRECKELIIVSRVVYGGLSPDIKKYVDRMIPCLLPYFEIRKGKMRHPYRFKNRFKLKFVFYSDISGGDFLLQGQENRALHEFAAENLKETKRKEAKIMNRMRPVYRNGVENSPEWKDEKKIMDVYAEALSKNFSAKKCECLYVGDIVNIKEVMF